MSERCYREVNGVYFTRNTHRPDCGEPECRGCRPCPEQHCTARRNCSWHLDEGQLTCGRCIAGVRTDLRWIEALAALLLTAAINDGVESEAAALAGPAVDPEAWSRRKVAARQHADTGRAWHVSLIEDDDEHHPARVLGVWAMMLAEDYGHDMPIDASLTWMVDYLDRNLARVAHDEDQDFGLLRRELRKCRQHLEAVLHNDRRPDRGAPCRSCAAPAPRLKLEPGHWCEDEDCTRMHYDDDSGDRWVCPRDPEHRWTMADYRRWVYADAVAQRGEDGRIGA